MTAGIAYGMKIMSRENRAKRPTTMSRMSATASETTICSGISTSENTEDEAHAVEERTRR